MARRYRKMGRRTAVVREYSRSIGKGVYKGGVPYSRASLVKGMVPRYGNMKFKAAFQCKTDVGVTTMNHGFRLTQPDNFDGGGNAVTDWTSAANLYDEFRVRGIKIKFIPQRPNDTTSQVFYNPAYVFADFDSTGLNPTVATCVGYDNLSVHNLYMPWKRYLRVPRLANYSSTTVSRPGWMDTAAPAATGSLYMHSESLTANTEYGKIIITYYITFHNRK